MIEKKFVNEDLEIELTSFIDDKQNVWFRGKDIATILGYSNTTKAVWDHIDNEDKQLICCRTQNGASTKHPKCCPVVWTGQKNTSNCWSGETPPQQNDNRRKYCTFINESGFYSLVLSSKLESAKKFKHWVTSQVLPSTRKYGQYKLFDSPWNKMIIIGNETDLHYKVVDLIRRYYPDSILVAGLGENQDTEDKRLDSYKKGYMRGQPDLMVLDYHKDYKGLCIEFKSPTNSYHVSEAQLEMKKYINNGYAFILSNDYDKISKNIHEYMKDIRVHVQYCVNIVSNNSV